MTESTEPVCAVCQEEKSPMSSAVFVDPETGAQSERLVCRDCEKELEVVPIE